MKDDFDFISDEMLNDFDTFLKRIDPKNKLFKNTQENIKNIKLAKQGMQEKDFNIYNQENVKENKYFKH